MPCSQGPLEPIWLASHTAALRCEAAPTARPKVPMRRRGADCPVVVTKAGVMLVERRGQVIAVGSEPTGNRRSSNSRRKAAAFVRWHEPDDARVSSPDL